MNKVFTATRTEITLVEAIQWAGDNLEDILSTVRSLELQMYFGISPQIVPRPKQLQYVVSIEHTKNKVRNFTHVNWQTVEIGDYFVRNAANANYYAGNWKVISKAEFESQYERTNKEV